jgi:UDP-N-acetylmuramoyl-tripeptide--D-alanyl-D-alanine ligase
MINNQKPDGNFNYQYDFVKREMDKGDSQVRQAGALWGLALMYQYEQDPRNRAALDKALKFFLDHTRPGPAEGSLLIAYPGDSSCKTGTVALVALGIIEYLRTEKAGKVKLGDTYRQKLIRSLNGYIHHLTFMRLENRHFSSYYSLRRKTRNKGFSPYFDGEAMLCLVKAARYMGRNDLIPLIENSAMKMAKYYTVDQWSEDPDSDKTKGFFQWSCMAFWEYQDAGWKNAQTFGDYVLSLAWWMIHTHRTLKRTRNTAYAYEGIIHAYALAKKRNDRAAMNELAYTIDRGLYKLTSWQVGGPLQSRNKFLTANPADDPLAMGGIMNHRKEAPLRIDVTQHQMHAVILALKHVYNK